MPSNICPHCNGGPVSCFNSRPSQANGVYRWRTYECHACGQRFSTEETITRMQGSDVTLTLRHRAAFFVEEVQALATKHFGEANQIGILGRTRKLGRRSSADED